MYLLDTNVVSIVAPARRRTQADEELAGWIVANSADLFLSVVTAAEIENGIARARRTGAHRKAEMLAEWWGEVLHYWNDRILPIDLAVAREAGRLLDRALGAGIDPGFEDVAIAATGGLRGFTVLTLNGKDFRPLGVPFLNPFELLSS